MNRKGIAIVTSIIILVVIMALGTGVLFLTNTNLKSSENVRSNAIAEANAQSGMDVVSLLVRESYISSSTTSCTQSETANGTSTQYGTTKCFPSSITLPTNSSYALATNGYTRTSATQATIKIVGSSASGGQFVSEAIIKMNPGPTNLPPAFGMGLASEGTGNSEWWGFTFCRCCGSWKYRDKSWWAFCALWGKSRYTLY